MSKPKFETVLQAQRIAKKRLPRSVYVSLISGSEQGLTLDENVAAFSELGFAPRAGGLAPKRDLSTTVMGQQLALPVIIAPTGVQAIVPDGEVAVARAAASRGTAIGLSNFASKPIESVIEANPATFAQLYWIGDRDQMLERVERARAAGAVGLIFTGDYAFARGRDWGTPQIPRKMDLRTMARYSPEAMRHPRWLSRYVRAGHLPDLAAPNTVRRGEPAPMLGEAAATWAMTPPATWEDIAWLREQWGGPFLIKGVTRLDDAHRAVDAGVTALSVSNHGGNNLDGTPAPIRLLPDIAKTVGDQVEVLLDSGVRRGSDVVKAIALGARAVLIGRAYLWGLAADGQAGVEQVLDILREGIDSSMLGLGRSSLAELDPDDLDIPAGFTRKLGTVPR
nr:pre-mycofactocin synthase MftD [Rhodococcus wratislaviensis]GLK33169.1 alpha-hydroxy-acid oxidizing enzyme [Rhodococcus wratislaviensis]